MSIQDMTLDDLACFVQVVDSGGFTAAGRVRGRSTKQISRQVARLEGQLGTRLLTRTTRAVGLTDVGRRFYAKAVQILVDADEAAAVLETDDALTGEIRVCVPSLASIAGIAGALRELRHRHPGVAVQVSLTDHPRDLVAEGLDLQVVPARPSQTSMVVRRILTVEARLAAHRSYVAEHGAPERPEELARHECLRFVSESPQTVWTLVDDAGRAATVPVTGSVRSTSSEVLFSALLEGIGIGLCGGRFLAEQGAEQGLVRVLEGWQFEPMPLYAVYPRANRKSPLVEAFLECLVRALRGWL